MSSILREGESMIAFRRYAMLLRRKMDPYDGRGDVLDRAVKL